MPITKHNFIVKDVITLILGEHFILHKKVDQSVVDIAKDVTANKTDYTKKNKPRSNK